ncbi:TPA: hypothetical protein NV714_003561 [Escherichia coli]|nr:hypothetical protein [Escherichia coli]
MLKKFKEVYFKKTGKELAEKLASGYYHNNKIQIDNVFTQIMEYSESQYFHSILAGFKNYKTKSNRNLLDLVIDNKHITDDYLFLLIKILGKEKLVERNNADDHHLIVKAIHSRDNFIEFLDKYKIKQDYSVLKLNVKKGFELFYIATLLNKQKCIDYLFDNKPKMFNTTMIKGLSYLGFCLFKERYNLVYDAIDNKGLMLSTANDLKMDEGVLLIKSYLDSDQEIPIKLETFLKKIIKDNKYNLKVDERTLEIISTLDYDKGFSIIEPIVNKLNDENKLEILLCASVLGNANIFAKISDDLALKEHNIYQLLNVISNSKFNDVNKIGLFYDFIKSKYDIDFNNNTGSTIIIDMFKNNTAKLSSGIVDVLKRNNIDIFISDKDGKSAFDYMNVDIKAKAEQVYIVEIIDKEKKVLENIFNSKEEIVSTKVRTNRL